MQHCHGRLKPVTTIPWHSITMAGWSLVPPYHGTALPWQAEACHHHTMAQHYHGRLKPGTTIPWHSITMAGWSLLPPYNGTALPWQAEACYHHTVMHRTEPTQVGWPLRGPAHLLHRTNTTEGQALGQPGGAEEDSRFHEGHRHLSLVYHDEEESPPLVPPMTTVQPQPKTRSLMAMPFIL